MPAPTVIVASGHMIDGPDRAAPRFPPSEVPRVTAGVERALADWDAGPATTLICGGARGADLIAAERALARGARVRLVLALAVDEFVRRSVALPDTDWEARFRRVLRRAEVEVVDGPDDEQVFARANARMIELARALDERPHAIVVWDGREGDGPGGTRDLMTRLGYGGPDERLRVIDPTPRG